MKPMNIVLSVLCAASLSGCASTWDKHWGTQSAPFPDQGYWSDRTWRQDIARQWREDDRRLTRLRGSEFFR